MLCFWETATDTAASARDAAFAASAAAAASPVGPAGVFELSDASEKPAGHIEVRLRWTSAYLPPSGSIDAGREPTKGAERANGELWSWQEESPETQEEEEEEEEEKWAQGDPVHVSVPQPDEAAPQVGADRGLQGPSCMLLRGTWLHPSASVHLTQAPLPRPRHKTPPKESKKVTFVEPGLAQETQQVRLWRHLSELQAGICGTGIRNFSVAG